MSSTREDNQPAFMFYVQDWLCEPTLKVVSMGARGLWIDVLCLMARAPIKGYLMTPLGEPAGVDWLAKQLGRQESEIAPLWQELLDAGTPRSDDRGRVYSKRMVSDKTLSEKRAEAGRLGGSVKQTGSKTKQAQATPENETESESENEVDSSAVVVRKKKVVYSDDFLAFWKAYPRRVGKGAAFAAWKRRTDPPSLEDVLSAISAQSESEQWQKDGGRFVPHPATWLNQRRWEDDVDPAKGDSNGRPGTSKRPIHDGDWKTPERLG